MMEVIFYWTGLIIWASMSLALAVVICYLTWAHLSISVALSFTAIKTDTVTDEWKQKRLYKIRLYIHMLLRPKSTLDLMDSTITNEKYELDFRGWLPSVRYKEAH